MSNPRKISLTREEDQLAKRRAKQKLDRIFPRRDLIGNKIMIRGTKFQEFYQEERLNIFEEKRSK